MNTAERKAWETRPVSGISGLNGTKSKVWLELTAENAGKILQLFTKNYINIFQTASPFQRIPVIQLVSFQFLSPSDSINIYGRKGKEILSVEDEQATKILQMPG